MAKKLKIGNAQAFWGDSTEAAAQLLQQQPDLDYITLDYLSEVSMSIMAAQREKDPNAGFARDFVDVISSLTPFWSQGSKVKIVANAGGLEPKRCALACVEVLRKAGCSHLTIGVVSGDDVLTAIKNDSGADCFRNLETGESAAGKVKDFVTANAYVGSKPIVDALKLGADIVITGRVADPSLTVGPCIAHFGWSFKDFDQLAQATVAGHLIECGTQVCGGISTHWLDVPDNADIGFPFVEVEENGHFAITKPLTAGGKIDIRTVKEQLLYEIGDPNAYLSPDVTVSFLSLSLKEDGQNRVLVTGAKGLPPPSTLKVSATYSDGYRAEGTLAIFGRDAKAKSLKCGEIILNRVSQAGYNLEHTLVECIGGGDLVPAVGALLGKSLECMLRVSVADHRKEAVEYFTKQIAPLVTCGPQGTTGYTSGRPHVRPVFGYWPCLINSNNVTSHVECFGVKK